MRNLGLVAVLVLTSSMAYSNDIHHIFHQLTEAVGDQSRNLPTLKIRPGKSKVAAYSSEKNTIFIDQVALDICRQFGEQEASAIAFLIAHELTHFYQKHDWTESGFATTFLSGAKRYDRHKANEKEADIYGAFISYLAGYQTVTIIPNLLSRIYEVYELDDEKLLAYPNLKERQAVSHEVCQQVKTLIQVYETGNFLFALHQLEEAYYCYQYVSKFIRCKEVFNNLGATALYAATSIQNYQSENYAYPIALDPHLPLRSPAELTKNELLSTAIEQLSNAVAYDPTYYSAFINLACAYELNNQQKAYQSLTTKLKQLPLSQKQQAQLLILEGIVAAKQQNRQAKSLFQQARKMSHHSFIKQLAKYNEQLTLGKRVKTKYVARKTSIEDQIEGYNMLTHRPTTNQSVWLNSQTTVLEIGEMQQSLFATINQHQLLWTRHTNAATVQNVKVGMKATAIFEAYGTTEQTINSVGGNWLIHAEKGLIFEIDEKDRVVAWGIFMLR